MSKTAVYVDLVEKQSVSYSVRGKITFRHKIWGQCQKRSGWLCGFSLLSKIETRAFVPPYSVMGGSQPAADGRGQTHGCCDEPPALKAKCWCCCFVLGIAPSLVSNIMTRMGGEGGQCQDPLYDPNRNIFMDWNSLFPRHILKGC